MYSPENERGNLQAEIDIHNCFKTSDFKGIEHHDETYALRSSNRTA